MHLFHEAKQQLVAAMAQPDSSSQSLSRARVVQLGDLGGYKHRPGQWIVAGSFMPACIVAGAPSSTYVQLSAL
jgi:hypothetical protein